MMHWTCFACSSRYSNWQQLRLQSKASKHWCTRLLWATLAVHKIVETRNTSSNHLTLQKAGGAFFYQQTIKPPNQTKCKLALASHMLHTACVVTLLSYKLQPCAFDGMVRRSFWGFHRAASQRFAMNTGTRQHVRRVWPAAKLQEINCNTPQWALNSVWNRKYMEPSLGYTLQQLWRDAEPTSATKQPARR